LKDQARVLYLHPAIQIRFSFVLPEKQTTTTEIIEHRDAPRMYWFFTIVSKSIFIIALGSKSLVRSKTNSRSLSGSIILYVDRQSVKEEMLNIPNKNTAT